MSLFKRFFGGDQQPKQRIRICVECGMPVGDHKEWCSILRGEKEMKQNALRTSQPGGGNAPVLAE